MISSSDAFVCDLTHVATSTAVPPRYCSNPNVLFELGYAFKSIGPERIVFVLNEKHGPVSEMPFDFAHRQRPVTFRSPDDSRAPEEIQARLVEVLAPIVALGRRDGSSINRVQAIRTEFEASVRNGTFHKFQRPGAAVGKGDARESRFVHASARSNTR